MSTHYRCANSSRRQRVRDTLGADGKPIVNGIDWLEVDPADQRTLHVRLIHPLPGEANGVPAAPALATENLVIEGGVRVRGIKVTGIAPAGKVLTLTVDRTGDFSRYTLRLIAPSSADGAPPAGFDPQLAAVDFTFKVNCPSDFDCADEEECPEPPLAAPAINYLARDYGALRRLLLDRLAMTLPEWKERNPADLGVALVEALAYVGDHLSYAQDAVATEAYLGTARRRASVRRHARLVDYAMHDGCNARTWLCLTVDGDLNGTSSQPVIGKGAQFAAGAEGAIIFEALHSLVNLKEARNAIAFYTWGDSDCCLPKGATRAWLGGSAATLDLAAGDALIFEERLSPATGREEDADPAHRHVVRLVAPPQETVDPLNGAAVVEIVWHDDDALPFALSLRDFPNPADASAPLSAAVARGNVLLADHGATQNAGTLLEPARVPISGAYRPRFTKTGLTHAMPYIDASARKTSAAFALRVDPRKAIAQMTLRTVGTTWRARRDLLESDSLAAEFVVEMDEEGGATLRFGDDIQGRTPPPGAAFSVTCRLGSGAEGNVGADAIDRLVTPIAGVTRVRNPLPAVGGSAPESMERVRLHAPQVFRYQERAVTEADYAAVAQLHPDVQRATAVRRWTGSWYTIFITCDRRGGRPVTPAFEAEMDVWLDRFRLAGYDVEIDAPRYVALDLALTVCVAGGYQRSNVKRALLDRFSTRDFADGRRGFFHPDNYTFGQPVYLSQVIAAAMAVPGVQWVDAEESATKPNRFRRLGQDAQGAVEAGFLAFNRVEIARLDNDPSLPENGKLEFYMEGGL